MSHPQKSSVPEFSSTVYQPGLRAVFEGEPSSRWRAQFRDPFSQLEKNSNRLLPRPGRATRVPA